MSIETAVERIADKIAESYQVVREKGGALPVTRNVDKLPDAIRTIEGDFAFGYYDWWGPKMTGPNSPAPYAVGAHVWNTTDTPWKAFDGSNETYWGNVYSNKIETAHLKFDFGESTKIAGFQFMEYGDNPGGLPKIITIYGSDDDQNWDLIIVDDYSNEEECISPRDISFDVVKYRFYRFDLSGKSWITDDLTNSYTLAIGDIRIATFTRDLSYCPVINLQEKTIIPSPAQQVVAPDENYVGFSKITVEAASLQTKKVGASEEEQIVTPDEGVYGLSSVIVEKIPSIYKDTSDATASADDITEGKTAYINGEKIVGTGSPKDNYSWWSPRMLSNTTFREPSLAHANLQSKTVTPASSAQVVEPDDSHDGLSSVTVNAIPSVYNDTSDATATASDIAEGKTAYANGIKVMGSMPSVEVPTPSIDVSSTGLITASNVMNAGYTNGGNKSETLQLTRKTAETFVPTTTNQTIASGQYITGAQTIKGDANLKASNIKSGVSIFGVTGDYTGATPNLQTKTVTPTVSSQTVTPDSTHDGLSKVTVNAIPSSYKDTSDATASAGDILTGKTAYVNGEKVTGVGLYPNANVTVVLMNNTTYDITQCNYTHLIPGDSDLYTASTGFQITKGSTASFLMCPGLVSFFLVQVSSIKVRLNKMSDNAVAPYFWAWNSFTNINLSSDWQNVNSVNSIIHGVINLAGRVTSPVRYEIEFANV